MPAGLDLERAVLDVEVRRQAALETVEDLAGPGQPAVVDDHVRRHDRTARGDRPDVQVVHVDHPVDRDDVTAHVVEIGAGRRRLQQDRGRLAEQAPGPRHDQCRHEQRRDRVGDLLSGRDDHESGENNRGGAEQVAQDLEVGTAHVQALSLRRVQPPGRDRVRCQSDQGDDQHQAALDLGRVGEPAQG